MTIALALILAYLIGSFPSAYLVGRLRLHADIRDIGSHNMGAMNTFYQAGFWTGLLVLAMDIGKGAATLGVARALGTPLVVQFLAGAAGLVGHNWPVFLNFKGGKGGAMCIGILAVVMPWGIPLYLGVFLTLLWLTRFPTLAYSLAFFPWIAFSWYYHSWQFFVYSSGILLFVVFRYVTRVREMRARGGSWHRVFHRRSFSDRF